VAIPSERLTWTLLSDVEIEQMIERLWDRYHALDPNDKAERLDTLDKITFYTQILKERRAGRKQ